MLIGQVRIEIVDTPALWLQVLVDIAFIAAGLGALASIYTYLGSGRRVKVHAEAEGNEVTITVGNKGRIDAYLSFVGVVILWREHGWLRPRTPLALTAPVWLEDISMDQLVYLPPGYVLRWTLTWPPGDRVTFLKSPSAELDSVDRVTQVTAKAYNPIFRAVAYSYRSRKKVRIKGPHPMLRTRLRDAALAIRGRL
ncbi:hypothetical protein P3T36_004703 [Kitasatospora sp. MAP12-15]|uniref:hypothetical protein n=1 Tax=unclassified Kitasatospora TaxID=2633591 RepID=UPI0024731DC2|nr:hypothetical protein [Kitasatospora sp. MAP12-44]MDH6111549.1 hypothetical protein [Kitasatospora sp. MAP12-44]